MWFGVVWVFQWTRVWAESSVILSYSISTTPSSVIEGLYKFVHVLAQMNHQYIFSQVDENYVAGDGFMLNLLAVLQKLSLKISLAKVCT